MKCCAPHALLQAACGSKRAAEPVPEVVVLAHRVIQPAHVFVVANGVAGIAQADHLVDRLAVGRADIGKPGGEVRGCLAAKSILWCDDDVRGVPGIAERRTSERAITM